MKFEVFNGAGERVAEYRILSEARTHMDELGPGSLVKRDGKVFARAGRSPDAPPAPPPTSGLAFARETITPAIAAEMLAGRAPNRTANGERVQSYAADMRAGRWQDIHQPIALGPGGELLDGEHRLRAVIIADMPIVMWVARGVALDARWAIDQGRARSVGDALKINDGIKHGPKLASWFRVISSFETDCKAARVVSPARVRELAAKYPVSIAWALEHGPKGKILARSPVVAALIYAHRVLPEVTARFGKGYATGEQLVLGDPAYALRQSLLSAAANTREPDKTYALRTMRCIVAELRGERIERAQASEEALAFMRSLHAKLDGTEAETTTTETTEGGA